MGEYGWRKMNVYFAKRGYPDLEHVSSLYSVYEIVYGRQIGDIDCGNGRDD